MKLKTIIEKIDCEPLIVPNQDQEIKEGYVCDLLSEVMGKAKKGMIWITVHKNLNVVGVASMLDLPAIIITEGHTPNENFINKAKNEGISVLLSDKNSFEITNQLYELGIK
ncbi:MAG: DRTGG domain-containing protein [Fusobacteriota bacterium]